MPCWVTVTTEGGTSGLFNQDGNTENTGDNDNGIEVRLEVRLEVVQAGNHAEDIAMVRAAGLSVVDDNAPAPENIPDPTQMQVDTGS